VQFSGRYTLLSTTIKGFNEQFETSIPGNGGAIHHRNSASRHKAGQGGKINFWLMGLHKREGAVQIFQGKSGWVKAIDEWIIGAILRIRYT